MKKSMKKKGYVAFKLDLEKTFDNVNWDFLKSCLHDFGFPNTKTRLIMHCVTSLNLSLLWNGNKMPPFKPSHGLRQGYSLSPYLFILCMEKLSIAINDASITCIRSTASLDKYLGFPILNGRAKRSDFLFIIEKMQSRLASWKNKLLNKPGRLTLAESVPISIPS
jgi:hypothetical protein